MPAVTGNVTPVTAVRQLVAGPGGRGAVAKHTPAPLVVHQPGWCKPHQLMQHSPMPKLDVGGGAKPWSVRLVCDHHMQACMMPSVAVILSSSIPLQPAHRHPTTAVQGTCATMHYSPSAGQRCTANTYMWLFGHTLRRLQTSLRCGEVC